jgi:hypothetical protein
MGKRGLPPTNFFNISNDKQNQVGSNNLAGVTSEQTRAKEKEENTSMYGLNKSDTFFFVCYVTNCCVSFLSFRETVQTEAFVLKKVSWILWRKLNGTINFESRRCYLCKRCNVCSVVFIDSLT